MKTVTKVKILISVIVFATIMSTFGLVNADNNLYLGITELKNLNSPSMGYAIGNPSYDGKKIWNIVKFPNATSNSSSNVNAFCVRAGVGFSDVKKRQEYNRSYDMDTQKEQIASQNSILNNLVNGGNYNNILALLDLTYYPGDDNEDQRNSLLKNAKIYSDDYAYQITDNDIVAVEQAAIWYFTNQDESIYDMYGKTNWLNYTLNGGTYAPLADYNYAVGGGEGRQRNIQCELLYNYLIKTAKENGPSYTANSVNPIVVNSSLVTSQIDGDYTIVGPFSINVVNSNPFIATLNVNNDGKTISYNLLNSNKQNVSNNDISKVIGSSFYIKVPSKDLVKLNISVSTSYTTTTKTLWASTTNNQAQPIVLLEKQTLPGNFNYTFVPENTDQFDLSLRKYITKINDSNVAVSRVPRVDTTPLIKDTSTTANYYGPKNPLQVKRGDLITYNIRVYNEAQKEGRAVKITDQLPSGMEFVNIVSGPYKVEDYDKTTNTIVFVRTDSNNLSPFENSNSLDFETLTYVAKINSNTLAGVKTNVAWISEEYNQTDDQTIITQTYPADKDADRDSTPSIHPNVNKDNMQNYKGNDSNIAVEPANSNYFYKGEQDDDDFEKVIVVNDSKYTLIINKQNEDFTKSLAGATFNINGKDITVDQNGNIDLSDINIESATQVDKYVIKEVTAPNGYKLFTGTITLELHFIETEQGYEIDVSESKISGIDKDGNKLDLTSILKASIQNNTIVLKIKDEVITSKANIKIIKEDKENAKVLEGAIFEVNGNSITTDANGILHITDGIEITSANQIDKFIIKETKAPDGYTGFDGTIELELHYKQANESYVIDTQTTVVKILDKNGQETTTSLVTYEISQNNFIMHIKNEPIESIANIKIIKEDKENAKVLEGAIFDVNGKSITTDANGILHITDGIEITSANQIDTFIIKETKAPEGYTGFDGTITVELHYKQEDSSYVIDTLNTVVTIKDANSNVISSSDLVNYEITENNFIMHIKNVKQQGKYSIRIIKQDQNTQKPLAGAEFDINGKKSVTDENGTLYIGQNFEINSEDQVDKYIIRETKAPEGYTRFDGTIEIELHYMKENSSYVIDTNKTVVTLYDKDGNILAHSDLVSYEIEKNDCIIHIFNCPQPFDLALIKNVYAVNGKTVPDRLLSIDVSNLNINGSTAQIANTAIYKQNKTPYPVETGDIVTYRIRVYNEGYVNGYASEITEDIPNGLEFLWSSKQGDELDQDITFTQAEKEAIKFNQQMLWKYNEVNNTVSTTILSKENETLPGENLIIAFGDNDGSKTSSDLHYKEVYIMLRVIATDPGDIRNEACITKDEDENGNEVQDRDSDPDTWKKYEDDEDYDIVSLQNFDLALRKWIMGVSSDDVFDEKDYLKDKNNQYTREPRVDTSKLNTIGEDGKLITTAIYNGPKDPVSVTINDYVMYCIRVYNEGGLDGYASIVTDYLPPYLEFVDNSFNRGYGWTVSSDGRVVTTSYLNTKLIPACKYNQMDQITLSYEDVPIICKVKNTTSAGYINTNIAEIMKYEDKEHKEIADRDSKPGDTVIPDDNNLPTYMDDKTGSYIPGQYDDDDFEKVVCNIFDLSLLKWVSEVITTVDGKTVVTPTNFSPYDNPEKIAKVDIYRKSIQTTKVKFKFGIRITNEGNIAGAATEIKDIIPQGLKFNKSENPDWEQISDNVVKTTALADTILQPGEYADVFIILEWINGSENLGLKTNWAEISKDYNKENIPDIDSIPDNGRKEEDDMDDAKVLLTVSTGGTFGISKTNLIILILVFASLSGGIFIIKKVVDVK